MKKTIIMAIALMASYFGTVAAAVTHSLVVNFNDGKVVEYAFIESPKITFSGDEIMIVTNSGGNDVLQPVSDVKNLTFKSENGGVGDVTGNACIVVRYDGSTLAISGLGEGSKVSVYSVSGMLCKSASADADGAVSMDVRDLANGIYVAASQEHTFKFIKK